MPGEVSQAQSEILQIGGRLKVLLQGRVLHFPGAFTNQEGSESLYVVTLTSFRIFRASVCAGNAV